MSIVSRVKNPDIRVMGIDTSTRSIAFSVVERMDGELRLVAWGKYDLSGFSSIEEKLFVIGDVVPEMVQTYGPDRVVVEQTIYIQSPQTSRLLSYVVGHVLGSAMVYCDNVTDVPIMSWKSNLGYKSVKKTEIAEWEKEIGKKEAKKKAAFERKDRIARILKERIPAVRNLEDDDIMDSIGIAIWGVEK